MLKLQPYSSMVLIWKDGKSGYMNGLVHCIRSVRRKYSFLTFDKSFSRAPSASWWSSSAVPGFVGLRNSFQSRGTTCITRAFFRNHGPNIKVLHFQLLSSRSRICFERTLERKHYWTSGSQQNSIKRFCSSARRIFQKRFNFKNWLDGLWPSHPST